MQISVYQINQVQLTAAIAAAITGSAFSGNMIAYVMGSGWLGPDVLHITGGTALVQTVTTFASPINLPYAGASGQSVAKQYVDDISGVLASQVGTGGGGGGTGGGSVTNNYFTGTGTINNSFTGSTVYNTFVSGVVNSTINIGQITGNFVNMSFFVDPGTIGLDLAESFVGKGFYITGYALGCITSGTSSLNGNGSLLSGRIYCRDLINGKTILQPFTFNSGLYGFVSGGLLIPVTGYYRVGVELTNTLSGITKLSVGIFGIG